MSPPPKKGLAHCLASTARIVLLFVILSEAKNLVVASAREGQIYPLFLRMSNTSSSLLTRYSA